VFNLIVKYAGWAENRDTIPAARTLEHTNRLIIEQFKPGGELDAAAVSRLPTIFMQETYGAGDQVAHVGIITSIQGKRCVNDTLFR
jgi:hypothetical protein